MSLALGSFKNWLPTYSSIPSLPVPLNKLTSLPVAAPFLSLVYEYFSFEAYLKPHHPCMTSCNKPSNVCVPWAASCDIIYYSMSMFYLLWWRWGHLTWRGWSCHWGTGAWLAEWKMVHVGGHWRLLNMFAIDQSSDVGWPDGCVCEKPHSFFTLSLLFW